MKLRLPLDFLGVATQPFGPDQCRDQTVLGEAALGAKGVQDQIIERAAYPPQGSTLTVQAVPRVVDGGLRIYAVPVYTFDPQDGRHVDYIYAIVSAFRRPGLGTGPGPQSARSSAWRRRPTS